MFGKTAYLRTGIRGQSRADILLHHGRADGRLGPRHSRSGHHRHKTYGVAKKTRLYGIKVMADRGGTDVSMLIAGADLVLRHMRTRSCPKGVFVNISISGGMSLATNQAVERLVKNDVFVGVAAGNDGKELADRSPATARYVCVVAGTNKNDTWYKASNYGRRVDILAPASEVESTTINGETVSYSVPPSLSLSRARSRSMRGTSRRAGC